MIECWYIVEYPQRLIAILLGYWGNTLRTPELNTSIHQYLTKRNEPHCPKAVVLNFYQGARLPRVINKFSGERKFLRALQNGKFDQNIYQQTHLFLQLI